MTEREPPTEEALAAARYEAGMYKCLYDLWEKRASEREATAWRIRVRIHHATQYSYTERLPFEPDEDSGVTILGEPEPLYAATPPASTTERDALDREQIAALLYVARFPHSTWLRASLVETGLAYLQADAIIGLVQAPPKGEADPKAPWRGINCGGDLTPPASTTEREATIEQCAKIAETGCLVPPDGGSPTEDEREMCQGIANAIRALSRSTGSAPICARCGGKLHSDDPRPGDYCLDCNMADTPTINDICNHGRRARSTGSGDAS